MKKIKKLNYNYYNYYFITIIEPTEGLEYLIYFVGSVSAVVIDQYGMSRLNYHNYQNQGYLVMPVSVPVMPVSVWRIERDDHLY